MYGKSKDIKKEKIENLKKLFPEVVSEGKIDFNQLKMTLGANVETDNERYVLSWAGKQEAFKALQTPTTATLAPAPKDSVNFDTTENIFIEGENLEVLKVLQKAYYGKIKMIYIDPPYNTGNDSFIYPDKFSETKDEYLKRIGEKDEKGYLTKEGLFRKNSKENGQFHSNWLSMMYPRLFLARNLLRDDGVIFVSIDDNEVHNLRLLMNEIFGEENFVASIVWQKKYSASNDAKGIPAMHDYVIIYKKTDQFERNLFPRTEKQDSAYKYDDNDGKGFWRSDNLLVKSFSESYVFPIKNPTTQKEYLPPKGSCWRASKTTIEEWIKENRIFFGQDGKGAPQLKRYLNEVQQGLVPNTWWDFKDAGHNDEANKELKSLFESKAPFDTPKPIRLIKRMIELATLKKENNIILDFFAGSGTTAHAVLDLNKEDGGGRKFICVQMPEKCAEDSEAFKAGYKTIADICKERIRRVIKRLKEDIASETKQSRLNFSRHSERSEESRLDLGFKAFKLKNSNFKIWRSDVIGNTEDLEKQLKIFEKPVKPEAEKTNMLYEIMLKSGYGLNTKIEEKKITVGAYYSIASGEMVIALSKLNAKAIKEIIKLNPKKCICLDAVFEGNDQLKTNTVFQMKDAGIDFKTI